MPNSRSLIIGWKKVCIFTSKILPLNPQTVRELHLNWNSKGAHIPAGVSFFSVAVNRVFPFMVQLGFTRAATGYWHRVTLPRWKFEEVPRHKKFVVSLVIALKTVIAALQTNRSSWPFSAAAIVMRKTVSLVARNKFLKRDTATIYLRGWHFLIPFSYPSYHWKCNVLVSATLCSLGARGFSCAVSSVFRLSLKKWRKLLARRTDKKPLVPRVNAAFKTGQGCYRSVRYRSVSEALHSKNVIQL